MVLKNVLTNNDEEKETLPIVTIRNLQANGWSSRFVILPKEWVNRNRLDSGSPIKIIDKGDVLEIVAAHPDAKPTLGQKKRDKERDRGAKAQQ